MARDSRRGRTPAAGGTLAPRQDTSRTRTPATAGRTRPRWVSLLLRCLAAARWILICNINVLPTHVLLTKQPKLFFFHFHLLPTIISNFFLSWVLIVKDVENKTRWCNVSIVVFKSHQEQMFIKLAQVFHWNWIWLCLYFASVQFPALLLCFPNVVVSRVTVGLNSSKWSSNYWIFSLYWCDWSIIPQ